MENVLLNFASTITCIVLLIHFSSFVSDTYDGQLMIRNMGYEPPFFTSGLYYLYKVISFLIFAITVIISCINYSWWLLLIIPISFFIIGSLLAAITNATLKDMLGLSFTRMLAIITTIVADVILVVQWFK